MDARSIAATTANGGILTPATDIDYDPTVPEYQFDASSYDTRVYQRLWQGRATMPCSSLAPTSRTGRRSHRWRDNLLLKVASVYHRPRHHHR